MGDRRNDVEMGNMSEDGDFEVDSEATSQLNEFFRDVDEMKDSMAQIAENVKTIKHIYAELLTCTSTEQSAELRKEASDVRAATDAVAQRLRLQMKKIRKENDEFNKTHDNDPSLVKIRTNMHGTLVRKFLDLMQEYQQVLTKYDKKIREKAIREVQLVSPDADPEDIDEILDQGGDITENIFQKHIMEDRKHTKAKQTLDYLKEKHNDLLNLEKSIMELNQLFMDMAILVETQGDLIDQIEFSVMNSKAYTEKAVQTLHETEQIVHDTRKKKICIVITVVLILIVAAVVIGLVTGIIPAVVG